MIGLIVKSVGELGEDIDAELRGSLYRDEEDGFCDGG